MNIAGRCTNLSYYVVKVVYNYYQVAQTQPIYKRISWAKKHRFVILWRFFSFLGAEEKT